MGVLSVILVDPFAGIAEIASGEFEPWSWALATTTEAANHNKILSRGAIFMFIENVEKSFLNHTQ